MPTVTGVASLSHHPTASAAGIWSPFFGRAGPLVPAHPTVAGSGSFYGPGVATLFVRSAPYPEWIANLTLAVHGLGRQAKAVDLAVASGNPGDSGEIMNLYVRGGGYPALGGITLAARSDPPTSDFLNLYAAGAGLTPGASPLASPLNLGVARGPEAGMTLALGNFAVESDLTLFVSGVPSAGGSADLYVCGEGGDADADVTLAIPAVSGWAASDGDVTLAIPAAVGTPSGSSDLFTSGWSG